MTLYDFEKLNLRTGDLIQFDTGDVIITGVFEHLFNSRSIVLGCFVSVSDVRPRNKHWWGFSGGPNGTDLYLVVSVRKVSKELFTFYWNMYGPNRI